MTTTDRPVDNGVNIQALLDARNALTAAPEAAQFTWRASCTWCTAPTAAPPSRASPASAPAEHRTQIRFEADHPVLRVRRPRRHPAEFVLVGVAGCLTAGVAAVAQNRGIQLRSVTATIEGDMNILRHPRRRSRRPQRIRRDQGPVRHRRRRHPEDIEALVAQSQKRSAVFDIMANPTNVTVEMA